MTIDEAIQHCEEVMMENLEKTKDRNASDPIAINCGECAEEHRQLAEWLKELKAYRSSSEIPNTCGDAISRQSAIFLASDLKQDLPDDERIADMVMAHNEGILEYQTQLSLLPPVSPQQRTQQRTGRWIKTRLDDEPDKICDDCGTYCWKCSICGSDASGWGNYKYCPKCGTRMEVEE